MSQSVARRSLRTRFLVGYGRLSLWLAVPLSVPNLLLERYSVALLVMLAALGAALAGELARRGRLETASAFLTVLLGLATYGSVVGGEGMGGSAATFLTLVPIVATITGGTRAGALTLVIVVGSMMALLAVDGRPTPVPTEAADLLKLTVSRAVLIGGTGALSALLVGGADRLNADLDRARRRALAADQAKSRLLAHCSHDLRTPLTAVQGYAGRLADEALDDGRTADVEDLVRIDRASRELVEIIDHVLELARLESLEGSVEASPHRLVDHLTAALQRHADGLEARFDLSYPRLGVLRITVRGGLGGALDPSVDPFEPFWNGGLELALCREIAHRAGGRAWAEPGAAPALCFELPMREEPDDSRELPRVAC